MIASGIISFRTKAECHIVFALAIPLQPRLLALLKWLDATKIFRKREKKSDAWFCGVCALFVSVSCFSVSYMSQASYRYQNSQSCCQFLTHTRPGEHCNISQRWLTGPSRLQPHRTHPLCIVPPPIRRNSKGHLFRTEKCFSRLANPNVRKSKMHKLWWFSK